MKIDNMILICTLFSYSGPAIDIGNWNAAKIFSYTKIKAATNNFKEVIGRGSFGFVYLEKLSDGKLVAVKVRFDRTQLGADYFINEDYHLKFSMISLSNHKEVSAK